MGVKTYIYDRRFFQNTKELERDSAGAAVDILLKHFSPASVVDIGCGAGIYLKELSLKGVEILGFDGSPAALEESLVEDKIKIHDLCRPLELGRKFDLCLCFEVAEHLEEECADNLVDILTGASDSVVFTAATPGQGPLSLGHINEQNPDYWILKMKKKGFVLAEELTKKIKKEMEEKKVVWWISKNLMVFENEKK